MSGLKSTSFLTARIACKMYFYVTNPKKNIFKPELQNSMHTDNSKHYVNMVHKHTCVSALKIVNPSK